MIKQKVAILGPGSWGTALAQVLNDNGHDVCLWGNIPAQIDELNTRHTNTHYFKDVVLDEKIKATLDLTEALSDADAVLFVVPTKVMRLVAKQVAEVLDHKVVVLHASKGLEPGTHERLSTILEEEIPTELRSEIVVVSGPSHAEETIVRDLTLITAASKDLEAAKIADLFFNRSFLDPMVKNEFTKELCQLLEKHSLVPVTKIEDLEEIKKELREITPHNYTGI